MTIHTVTFLFSSDPNNGAININSNTVYQGNSFSVDLSRYPISIPAKAKSCSLTVIGASIPYISPNLVMNANSNFNFIYNGTAYTLILPTGLYSLNNVASAISLILTSMTLPSNLFTFVGNSATQMVSIVYNYANLQVDFTQPYNFAYIMGFNSGVYPPSPSYVGETSTAQNVAEFDQLTSYTIISDLVSIGLPFNGNSKNVIAVIPITSTPGSIVIYDPQNAQRIEAGSLIGVVRTIANFSITDSRANNINMLNQPWSIVCRFDYDI